MKARLATLVLLAVTLAAGAMMMEMGVRVLAPQQLVRAYTTYDADLGPVPRPHARYHDLYGNDYWVRTNGHGMRQDDEVDMAPGRKRIAIYGDSFTFGWGVEVEASFVGLLKTRLEAADPRLQLLNQGQGGYATGHVKKLLDRDVPILKPSAAIYFFNSNDIVDAAVTDPDYRVATYAFTETGPVIADAQPYSATKRFLLLHTPYTWLNQHSHLFVLAKDLLKRALAAPPAASAPGASLAAAVQAPAYTVTEEQARALDAEAERLVALSVAHLRRLTPAAQGVPLLIVWIPSEDEMFRPQAPLPQLALFARMRAALAALAAEDGSFAFLDPTRLIRRDPEFLARAGSLHFVGDGHFNVTGNAWFAGLVAEPISAFLASHAQ